MSDRLKNELGHYPIELMGRYELVWLLSGGN